MFLVAPAPPAISVLVCETFACKRTGAQVAGRGKVRGDVRAARAYGMRSGFVKIGEHACDFHSRLFVRVLH